MTGRGLAGLNHVPDRAAALPAIELMPVMRLHIFRRAGPRHNGRVHSFFIQSAANANNHDFYIVRMRMIVNLGR